MVWCVQLLQVPGVEGRATAATFDAINSALFLVAEQRSWHIFVSRPNTARGTAVQRVASVSAVAGAVPLMLGPLGISAQLTSGHIITQSVEEIARPCSEELAGLPERQRREAARSACLCLQLTLCLVAEIASGTGAVHVDLLQYQRQMLADATSIYGHGLR